MRKLLAALLMVPALSHAEFETGNSLLSKMQSIHLVEKSVALGFIKGVADVYVYVTFCPPNNAANITAGQLSDMVQNHLEANPAIRHRTAESIIGDLFKRTWPCQNNNKGRI